MRNCDSCNTELVPVSPELMRRRNDYRNYEDALVITIQGGYGMLIDEYVPPFVLCGECGTKLIRASGFLITPETEFLVEKSTQDSK